MNTGPEEQREDDSKDLWTVIAKMAYGPFYDTFMMIWTLCSYELYEVHYNAPIAADTKCIVYRFYMLDSIEDINRHKVKSNHANLAISLWILLAWQSPNPALRITICWRTAQLQ